MTDRSEKISALPHITWDGGEVCTDDRKCGGLIRRQNTKDCQELQKDCLEWKKTVGKEDCTTT